MIFWIPSIVFLLVSGLVLLGAFIWLDRYSPQAKAKTQRLQDIETYLAGQAGRSRRNQHQGLLAVDKWLREHVPPYNRLDDLLARANSQHSPLQIVGLCLAVALAAFVLAGVAGAGFLLALLLGAVFSATPILYLLRAGLVRRGKFENKLPEALDFLTRALRAGHSITVAMGMAANELADPIGTEFGIVFDEIGFGIPFDESMTAMTHRVGSPDLDFLVIALLIQRETGGNLTELLDSLAKTVRERIKLKGKVRTLSSEGRFSAILLGSLPFVLGAVLSLLNPGYMSALWETPQGHNLMQIGAVLLVVGFIVLQRIIRIKV
jgi:tight adherence protein B